MEDISCFLWYVPKATCYNFPQTHDIIQVEKHVTSDVVIWKHVIIHDSDMKAGTSLSQQLGFNVTGNKTND